MKEMFPHNVSASVTRRLAQIADSYRNFDKVFLISQFEFPVKGPEFPEPPVYGFSNFDAAEEFFRDKELDHEKWGIFGPFKTVNEVPVKWDDDKENIQEVTFTIRYKNETNEIFTLDKQDDALFLNLASFDMFAVPYYTKLYGADYAKKLRDFILNEYEERGNHGSVVVIIMHRSTSIIVKGPNYNDDNFGKGIESPAGTFVI